MPSFTLVCRAACRLLLLGTLAVSSGCTTTHSPLPVASVTRSYILNLSLAQLTFDRQPDALPVARPYVAKMNSYAITKGRKVTHGGEVTVLVLTVETGDDRKRHRVMVPVAPARGGSYDLRPLQNVSAELAKYKPEFQSIRARTVTVTKRSSIPLLRRSKAADIARRVQELHASILATAEEIPSLEDSKLQLEATHIFMKAGVQDAAYLALENAKEALANVRPSDEQESEKVTVLSQQMEILENTLHKKLPYNF